LVLVKVLDTTLREGEQDAEVYFEPHAKLEIARKLNEIGIDIIEAGNPFVDEEIREDVRRIANAGLNARIAAHSRSLLKDVDAALECGVNFLGIFYCVSDERLNGVFKTELNSAIEQIVRTIRYAREKKPDIMIRYTPEDTVRSNFENVASASIEAVRAGADIISVADTTGYMIPGIRSMYDFVLSLRERFDKNNLSPMIAVHCHNDRGLALSNALDGYRAGAEIIDASVLGLGERAGIVDLATLVSVLSLDFGEDKYDLKKLRDLYEIVSEYSGVEIPKNHPMVGKDAFTHYAGVHTQAALLDPKHYESLHPHLFGRERTIALGRMSGMSSLEYNLELIKKNNIERKIKERLLGKIKRAKRGTISINQLGHMVELELIDYENGKYNN